MNTCCKPLSTLKRSSGVFALLGALAMMSSPASHQASAGRSSQVQLVPGQTSSPIQRSSFQHPVDAKMIAPAPIAGEGDRSLSPYFHVQSEDPSLDKLPLKATSADIDIAGMIADVTVTQVYANEGTRPLEAIYIFPASTRVAVYAMKMTIGERTVVAKISEREQARRDYEAAKAQGKSASLLEQQRPNVFQMNVANILPGDEIQVEMRYTELLVPTDGIYELVYPTVVGPRYSTTPAASAPDTEKWVENPYLIKGQAPTYSFDLTATLDAGMPIQEIAVPTHRVNVQYGGESRATLTLDAAESAGGNRDFILRYRLAGGQVQSGLLLYEGEEENFFLLMNQPPARVVDDMIVPREYVFVVDVSGSMSGFPLNTSKTLLRDLIGSLRPEERFNVILFAGTSSAMAPESQPATSANINRAIQVIDKQRGGGGTKLLPALQRALEMPSQDGFSRSIIVVSDGYISVEAQVFDLIRKSLDEANLFSFGIGSSVNRHLMEGMARVGQGEPLIITKPEEAAAKAEKFRQYIQSPVLTNVEVVFNGFEAYDVEPLTIPDVLAERPVIVFGKWRGSPRGTISVGGIAGQQPYARHFDLRSFEPNRDNAALRYLWARHRIALLGDYNLLHSTDARIKEITDLGLEYNLLTAYTSFVAIDSLVRTDGKNTQTVTQPLPLPEGVSNQAVGQSVARSARMMAPPSTLGSGRGGASPSALSAPRRKLVRAESAPPPSSPLEQEPIAKSVSEKDDEASASELEAPTRLKLVALKVSGTLDRQPVEQLLNSHLTTMIACYDAMLGAGAGQSGNVLARFVIAADGTVESVEFVKLDKVINDKNLEACWRQRITRLKFAAGNGKTTVDVTWEIIG